MQKFFSRYVVIALGCIITMAHPISQGAEKNDSFSENETEIIKVSSRLPRQERIDITLGGFLSEDDEVREIKKKRLKILRARIRRIITKKHV